MKQVTAGRHHKLGPSLVTEGLCAFISSQQTAQWRGTSWPWSISSTKSCCLYSAAFSRSLWSSDDACISLLLARASSTLSFCFGSPVNWRYCSTTYIIIAAICKRCHSKIKLGVPWCRPGRYPYKLAFTTRKFLVIVVLCIPANNTRPACTNLSLYC